MASASDSDEPPYFCTTMLMRGSLLNPRTMLGNGGGATLRPRGVYRAGTPAPRVISGVGGFLEHLVGGGDPVELAGVLHVEPVVGHDRQQRVQHGTGEVAPRRDIGELPPPQGL